jgi:hypothetical protein
VKVLTGDEHFRDLDETLWLKNNEAEDEEKEEAGHTKSRERLNKRR